MKVTILESVLDIPECQEGLTLILYFKDGEVVASQDWKDIRTENRGDGRELIELYNYSKHWYDDYIVNRVKKIVLLEELV